METGFQDIDKLPLGKLIQPKYPKDIARKKKKTLTGSIKVKGPRKKDSR